jgi:hypothetical protein
MPKRHAENAPGDWYIDTECMDCSAARQYGASKSFMANLSTFVPAGTPVSEKGGDFGSKQESRAPSPPARLAAQMSRRMIPSSPKR